MISREITNAVKGPNTLLKTKNEIGTVMIPINVGNIRRENSELPKTKLHTETITLKSGGCTSDNNLESFSLSGIMVNLAVYNSSSQKLLSVKEGIRSAAAPTNKKVTIVRGFLAKLR
jgi:hypothetical protein